MLTSNGAYLSEGSLYLERDSAFEVTVTVSAYDPRFARTLYAMSATGRWSASARTIELRSPSGPALVGALSLVGGLPRVAIPYDLDNDGRPDTLPFEWADSGPA